jgi:hypothetical protein
VQTDPVDHQIVVDAPQLRGRGVVCVARALEARVELVDLCEDLPCLRLLCADGGIARRGAGDDTGGDKGGDDDCGLSL